MEASIVKKFAYPVLLLGFLSCSNTGTSDAPHFEIVQLRDGVWAAMATHGRHAICNAGIVHIGGNQVLVFDTFLTPKAGLELRETAESLTDSPVTFVVNSNFESDHIRGNQSFDDASFVSTTRIQQGVSEAEPLRLETEKSLSPDDLKDARARLKLATSDLERRDLELQVGYFEGLVTSIGTVITTPPTVVWDYKLNFTGEDRRVKLIPFRNAVTESDIALYLEADSLLFSSDLLVVDRHPSMLTSNLEGWRAALDSLDLLPVLEVIPGHGPITDKSAIDRTRDYLDMVETMAAEIVAGNGSADTATPLSPFDTLMRSDRFSANLEAVIRSSAPLE